MFKPIALVAILVVVGTLLGTLGTFSMPIGQGISHFWPGIVVQVDGAIWFGAWGVVAAAIFPVFSNLLTGGTPVMIVGYVPANLVQGLIPCWAFRHFGVAPDAPGRRGFLFFLCWAALLPSLAGAMLGVGALAIAGDVQGVGEFAYLAGTWAVANVLVSLALGWPVLKVLTPIWREAGLLYERYWS